MTIYRLIPAVPPDNAAWDNSLCQGEVVVRASSTGEARAMAALEEASRIMSGLPRSTTQVVASAFRDPNLYTVVVDDTGAYPPQGPVQVLSGKFSIPDGYVARPG